MTRVPRSLLSGSFEWWYLQVVDQGLLLTATVHQSGVSGDSAPYLSVCAIDPDRSGPGATGFWRIPLSTVHDGARLCADGMVVQETDGYRIAVQDGDLTVSLEISPASSPWGPPSWALCTDAASGRTANWCVLMPFGRATGRVEWRGRSIRIRASAYLDHNWGTYPIPEAVTAWTWLAVAHPGLTTIQAAVVPRTGERIHLSNLATDDLAPGAAPTGLAGSGPLEPGSPLRKAAELLGWTPDSPRFRLVKRSSYHHREVAVLTYTRWAVSGDHWAAAAGGRAGRLHGNHGGDSGR